MAVTLTAIPVLFGFLALVEALYAVADRAEAAGGCSDKG